ncbi:RidA family protein [Parathalassolituus penaei]|uniref:RidA family protein n=1 Tax=Parathalassolituus penaei TaxID=2997323 RepID=A0A9X3EC70_9GAMM|nr:RidA family protein [Parathalassolituus penaei]MCY0964000.1 RidA family protein [Parathalassolituus penaei]
MNIERINPQVRWSDVTIYNGIAHFVEVPEGDAADMAAQARQILAQAEATLARAGTDKRSLLSATIYITNFANLAAFNEVWDAWLPEGCAPSRACVRVELADPSWLVEIAFVAAVKG